MIRKSIALVAATTAIVGGSALGLTSAQAAPAKHLPATPVTAANLPSAQQFRGDGNRVIGLHTVKTTKGEAKGTVVGCQTSTLTDYGARVSYTRTYARGSRITAAAAIGSYGSHYDADIAARATAYDLNTCNEMLTERRPEMVVDRQLHADVKLPTGQLAHLYELDVHDSTTGTTYVMQSGVVATGTHVEVLGMTFTDPQSMMDLGNVKATMASTVRTLA